VWLGVLLAEWQTWAPCKHARMFSNALAPAHTTHRRCAQPLTHLLDLHPDRVAPRGGYCMQLPRPAPRPPLPHLQDMQRLLGSG